MGNQKNDDDWDDDGNQPQEPAENQEQSSRNVEGFNDSNGGDGENDFQQPQPNADMPPGTEEQPNREEPTAEPSSYQSNDAFENHQNASASNDDGDAGGEENAGNTTPLCDEEESKE